MAIVTMKREKKMHRKFFAVGILDARSGDLHSKRSVLSPIGVCVSGDITEKNRKKKFR